MIDDNASSVESEKPTIQSSRLTEKTSISTTAEVDSDVDNTIKTLGGAFGLATGLGAISYVFGFITVNSFLGVHGIITYSANNQFIAAGLGSWLFLFIIGVIFCRS
jgi:hypothetical protein